MTYLLCPRRLILHRKRIFSLNLFFSHSNTPKIKVFQIFAKGHPRVIFGENNLIASDVIDTEYFIEYVEDNDGVDSGTDEEVSVGGSGVDIKYVDAAYGEDI